MDLNPSSFNLVQSELCIHSELSYNQELSLPVLTQVQNGPITYMESCKLDLGLSFLIPEHAKLITTFSGLCIKRTYSYLVDYSVIRFYV